MGQVKRYKDEKNDVDKKKKQLEKTVKDLDGKLRTEMNNNKLASTTLVLSVTASSQCDIPTYSLGQSCSLSPSPMVPPCTLLSSEQTRGSPPPPLSTTS